MSNRLTLALERFDSLPVRKRLIVTFTGIMLLVLIFQLVWFNRLDSDSKKASAQLLSANQQISQFTQTQQDLNNGIYQQRNDPKRVQLNALQKQIDDVQSELEQKTLSLVRPEAMAQLLKEIFNNSKNLKLLSLTKQTPVALFEDKSQAGKADNPQILLYRHPLVMVFEGGYSDTQKFLQELESMQRKVNFEHFEFAVENYPKSKITLVVSTYSTSRQWIGG